MLPQPLLTLNFTTIPDTSISFPTQITCQTSPNFTGIESCAAFLSLRLGVRGLLAHITQTFHKFPVVNGVLMKLAS